MESGGVRKWQARSGGEWRGERQGVESGVSGQGNGERRRCRVERCENGRRDEE